MNKSRMILAVIGGIVGVAVLAMAYFTWSAYSDKVAAIEGDDEGTDGLEAVESKAQALIRKPVYPCAQSVKSIESNAVAVVAWKESARKLAAKGDRFHEKTTPLAFKEFISTDAKRLSSLPGSVVGKLVKSDFAFGPFKDYVAEGKVPVESKLAELQRQWDDVATVVELLSANGIAELTDVQFKVNGAVDEAGATGAKQKSKDKRKAAKAKDSAADDAPVKYSYVFSFTTKPVAFVKVVNALETCDRFIVVENFTFSRAKDVIAEALGDGEKKSEAQQRPNRRNRRRNVVVEEKKEDEGALKNGIITDPVQDDPFAVQLTVSVYDFRSLEEKPSQVEEEKK